VTAGKWRVSASLAISVFLRRHDRIENADRPDMTDAADTTDPIDRIEPTEPIDPTDSTEPTDPIDRTEPREPMLSTESFDLIDQCELSVSLIGRSWQQPRTTVEVAPHAEAKQRC
jgi:hypothetical protein